MTKGENMTVFEGASEQDPLAIPDPDAERVGVELLVVGRRDGADTVTITVHGLWTGPVPVVSAWHHDGSIEASVVGTDDGGPARPYCVTVDVDIDGADSLVVRGRGRSEEIALEDLDDLSIVCGADPLLAGIPTPFLHRRGDRLVRVDSDPAPSTVRRSRITVVA